MPTAPPIACVCGGRKPAGQPCPRCGRGKRTPHTKSTSERGYDWAWQRFRIRFLREHPLCEDCTRELGIVTAAVELHHKQKIKDRPDLRLDPDNIMPLCVEHHTQRTARGE